MLRRWNGVHQAETRYVRPKSTVRRGAANCRRRVARTELLPAVLFQLFEHFVEVEARGLLALRKVLERGQELGDEGLRRDERERAIDDPVVVRVRGRVGALVRI